jgi:hypothetical protein
MAATFCRYIFNELHSRCAYVTLISRALTKIGICKFKYNSQYLNYMRILLKMEALGFSETSVPIFKTK